MKFLESYEEFSIKDRIKNLKKLPKDKKEIACDLSNDYSHAKNGKVTNLALHPELIDKIKNGNYPSGYSMGVDKNGFFIHTHRARSKSYENPSSIPVSVMKFIDSTG
jgi:hypothetical protein